jgi:uncharacterized protein YggE
MKIFLLLVLLAFGLPVAAQINSVPVAQLPTIKVTGTAEIQVAPDTVTLSFSVVDKNKSVAEAKKSNDETIAKVGNLAKSFGIAAADVKTDYIRVKEVNRRVKIKATEDDYEEVFDGYQVSRNLVIKLRDIKKFESFLTALLEAGVSDVDDVTFSSSRLREYKDQARARAMRAAQEKAVAMAKEISQFIGRAVSVEEKDIDGYRSPSANATQNISLAENQQNETIAVGAIFVKAQVEVLFLLN